MSFSTNKPGYLKQSSKKPGKPPGLVVNIKDSRSESWSLDVGSNPGLAKKKLDGTTTT